MVLVVTGCVETCLFQLTCPNSTGDEFSFNVQRPFGLMELEISFASEGVKMGQISNTGVRIQNQGLKKF